MLKLAQLENNLAKAETIEQCNAALEEFLKHYEIDTFSFTYYTYHPHSANKVKYETCSPRFARWHQHYLASEYQHIDSTMDFVYRAHLPIYWDLQQQLAQAQSQAEIAMRQASIQFGAQAGLSIPIHGPHNNFAILLVVQMQQQTLELKDPQLQYTFFLAAHLYYHYLQMHLLDNIQELQSFHLSQRELQCLTLIAQEYTVKQMAQTLELTERTIQFHIQNANKKLATKNKHQSVSKAIAHKLITI